MVESVGVPLADFVTALREEIRAARLGADPQVPIEVGPLTVEFTLLARREGEGKAGLKFWVVDAGVSGKLANESTQKVTMQLTPLAAGGAGPARVRDVDPGRSRRDDDG
ncbi:MAG: trypco2 family protein [Dermatophilaceae bacterium]